MLTQLIFIYIFILNFSCEGFIFPPKADNSFCGRNGQICVLAQNCPGVFRQVRAGNFPTICRFELDSVFVCCNKVRTNLPSCGKARNIVTTSGRIKQRSPRKPSALDVLIKQANAATINKKTFFNIKNINRLLEPFVVRGEETLENAYPWMAALGSQHSNGDMTWFCGGSLISRRLVLTAAHCLREGDPTIPHTLDTVRLGAHDLGDNPDNQDNPDDYGIRKIHIHPQYNASFSYHDIALIELAATGEGVRIRAEVGPVCLPPPIFGLEQPEVGSLVTVAGWGATSFGGIEAEKLQEATIQVISQEECHSNYTSISFSNLPLGVTQNIICAGEKSNLPLVKEILVDL